MSQAHLDGRNLSEANLSETNLRETQMSNVKLVKATIKDADLRGANLSQANLQGARLRYTILVDANFSRADLTGCFIYGASTWNTRLDGAIQTDLVLTRSSDPALFVLEPAITVDHLEAAQFLYLLYQNAYTPAFHSSLMRHIILILGQFTPERKETFKTILHDFWEQNYVPVFVDVTTFQDHTHAAMINALIGLSSGILIDLSDVPHSGVMFPRRSIPIQPLLREGKVERDVFPSVYHQMLPLYRYDNMANLRRFLAAYLHHLSTPSN